MDNIAKTSYYGYRKLLVDRHKLKITENESWFEKNSTESEIGFEADEATPTKSKLVCYVVQGVNGVEILVDKRLKEFYKKFL